MVSLAPPSAVGTSHSLLAATKTLILQHYTARCPESPHVRDSMKRRVGPHLFEEQQALIKTETFSELYAEFDSQHPNLVKRIQYELEAPWNLNDAYRETCLCASCESLRLFMEGLNVVSQMLKPLIAAA